MNRRNVTIVLLLCGMLNVTTGSLAHEADKEPDKKLSVLIDFSNWSVLSEGDVTITIEHEGYTSKSPYETKSGGFDAGDFAQAFYLHLTADTTDPVIKAEVFDKTKVRIFGYKKDGKFYPALQGKVTSKNLKPEQLPKVTNPPKG